MVPTRCRGPAVVTFDHLVDLTSASFAYPRLDGPARAAVARALVTHGVPPGVFVLSTCLRVEVAVAGDQTELKGRLGDLFGVLPVEPEIRDGQEAGEHLFRVAAGLESPIVGEVEVLTQFRQALNDLKAAPPVDGAFLKLIESAVAAGRRAREVMDTSPHDTMAALAAQMVGTHAEVAVVGSGTMAAAVVAALGALPAPPRVAMLSRSPEKVSNEHLDLLPMDDLAAVISAYPAVVSATAASTRLMDHDHLAEALQGRTTPLTIVDMAMPPDFSPSSSAPVTYVGIDDLARLARRREVTTDVADQVAAEAQQAHHRYTEGRIGPLIAGMLSVGEAVVSETVERFAGRLTNPDDRDVLHQTAHTVARTILDRPVRALRSSEDPRIVEAIASVFDDE